MPTPTYDIKATQLLCLSLKCLSDQLDLVKMDYPDDADIGDLQEALQDTGDVLYRLIADQKPTPAQGPADNCDGPSA